MDKLPHELLAEVLAHLGSADVLAVAGACSELREAAVEPPLWLELCRRDYSLSARLLTPAADGATRAQPLDLYKAAYLGWLQRCRATKARAAMIERRARSRRLHGRMRALCRCTGAASFCALPVGALSLAVLGMQLLRGDESVGALGVFAPVIGVLAVTVVACVAMVVTFNNDGDPNSVWHGLNGVVQDSNLVAIAERQYVYDNVASHHLLVLQFVLACTSAGLAALNLGGATDLDWLVVLAPFWVCLALPGLTWVPWLEDVLGWRWAWREEYDELQSFVAFLLTLVCVGGSSALLALRVDHPDLLQVDYWEAMAPLAGWLVLLAVVVLVQMCQGNGGDFALWTLLGALSTAVFVVLLALRMDGEYSADYALVFIPAFLAVACMCGAAVMGAN